MEFLNANISSCTNAPTEKEHKRPLTRPNNKLEEQLEYLETLELIFVEALRRANTLPSTLLPYFTTTESRIDCCSKRQKSLVK